MATIAKSKTNLACDRCRHRKSRCDGSRPSCSHCRSVGQICVYRPTPTSLETDTSVLFRLDQAEERLQAVEKRLLEGQLVGPTSRTSVSPRQIRNPPDLHTAAACRMLACWPRIRLCMTIPNFDPLTYLSEADTADPLLLQQANRSDFDTKGLTLWQAAQLLENIYDKLECLPVYIVALIELCPVLSRDNILAGIAECHPTGWSPNHDETLDLQCLTVPQLIIVSIACKTSETDVVAVHATAIASFSLLLNRLWTQLTAPDETRIPLSLAAAYCLAHFWARPFHALKLIQSIEPSINRSALRHPDDISIMKYYAKLYFILEGDVLLEIDDIPSSLNTGLLDFNDLQSDFQHPEPHVLCHTQVNNHFILRNHLNGILYLYTLNKAYAQPHELADLVCSISAQLHEWYRSQPLEQRFPRDATTFNMNVRSMTSRLKEIAIRYFSCVFLLHRPVLYFFLHKDMEYSVRPPDTSNTQSDQQPWVLESCRDCIESAALIISLCCSEPAPSTEKSRHSWFDYQMLLATYLVLLQVKSISALAPIFRNLGDIEHLLDRVELLVERSPTDSHKIHQNLAIMRNERHNFDIASPGNFTSPT